MPFISLTDCFSCYQDALRQIQGQAKRKSLLQAKRVPNAARKPRYPGLEKELRALTLKRRKEGKPVSFSFLRRAALRIFVTLKLSGAFRASNRFLQRFIVSCRLLIFVRFCSRNKFVHRRGKNKKLRSAEGRVPLVTAYFSELRKILLLRPPGQFEKLVATEILIRERRME